MYIAWRSSFQSTYEYIYASTVGNSRRRGDGDSRSLVFDISTDTLDMYDCDIGRFSWHIVLLDQMPRKTLRITADTDALSPVVGNPAASLRHAFWH